MQRANAARLIAAVGLACLTASGCGNSRTKPLAAPSGAGAATPTATSGPSFTPLSYPAAGVSLKYPLGWSVMPGTAPQVATITSGQATLALWRYPRNASLPKNTASLEAARVTLIAAVRGRDSTFTLISSKVTNVKGRPAIQLIGAETIAGHPRRAVSTHVFAYGAEVVLDGYAAAANFATLERTVFRRVLRSLRLRQPPAATPGTATTPGAATPGATTP